MWGPTAWGAFSPGHVGRCCHNLCPRCGPHPALFRSAAPSGWVVDTGRLDPGFLVLLVLPVLLEAHVNQRPRALRASGQDGAGCTKVKTKRRLPAAGQALPLHADRRGAAMLTLSISFRLSWRQT